MPSDLKAEAEALAGPHEHVEGDAWFCCAQCIYDCASGEWDCIDTARAGKPCDCGQAGRAARILARLQADHEEIARLRDKERVLDDLAKENWATMLELRALHESLLTAFGATHALLAAALPYEFWQHGTETQALRKIYEEAKVASLLAHLKARHGCDMESEDPDYGS